MAEALRMSEMSLDSGTSTWQSKISIKVKVFFWQSTQVLHSCPPQDIGIWLLEYGVVLEHPMLPIFEDSLRPQLLTLGSVRGPVRCSF